MKLLLLVADSMRYDCSRAKFSGAMVWDNAYACAPWTVASMASLLTGLSPSAAFHAGLADVVSEQPFTVADWLGGDIGYKCSASWLLSVGHFGRNFDVWHQSGDY
jgi:arylsulfatase A-like enzyme